MTLSLSPSSGKSAPSLHLIVERSPVLTALLWVIHALALIAAIANPLEVIVRLLLVGAILINLMHCRRSLNQECGLTLTPGGDWEVLMNGKATTGRLEADTLVTPWLVILNLRMPSRRLALPIFRDAVDPESFRQLRVYLKLHRHSRAPEAA